MLRAREIKKHLGASRFQRYASLLGFVSALIASVIGFLLAVQQQKTPWLPVEFAKANEEAAYSAARLERLHAELTKLQQRLVEAPAVPAESQIATALTQLKEDTRSLSERLKAIEVSIESTPEKALSIPLLRKDLESQRNTAVSENAALRSEIARLYDFNKWFFGLIATMALSTLGLAARNLFTKKDADEKA